MGSIAQTFAYEPTGSRVMPDRPDLLAEPEGAVQGTPTEPEGVAAARTHRELSSQSLRFQQALAERLGLNETDLRCYELLFNDVDSSAASAGVEAGAHGTGAQASALGAGKLAELTGLTTGAITGVLDRLERAGFVRREKSAEDRRQVQIRVLPERMREYAALNAPMVRGFAQLSARLTPEQTALVRDYVAAAALLFEREMQRLRGRDESVSGVGGPNELSGVLGHTREGRFELNRGASNLTMGSARGGLLYRLRHEGPAPQVVAREGHVHVEYNRGALRLFDFRKHALHVDLSERIAWELVIRGGVRKCDADLRGLRVSALDVRGGAEHAVFALPVPVGTVNVRISGGASHMRVLRPANTPARIQVSGGVSHLAIDTMELGAVGGTMRWESPNFESAVDRYDIQVSGGASHLRIACE